MKKSICSKKILGVGLNNEIVEEVLDYKFFRGEPLEAATLGQLLDLQRLYV
jgi:hypothetical protein